LSTDWLASRREVDGDNRVGGQARAKTGRASILRTDFYELFM